MNGFLLGAVTLQLLPQAILAAVMFVVWLQDRSQRHFLFWAQAFALNTLSWAMVPVGGYTYRATPVALIVLATFVSTAFLSALYRGVRAYEGERATPLVVAAGTVMIVGLQMAVWPFGNLPFIVYYLFLLGMSLLMARQLWRYGTGERIAALLLCGNALLFLLVRVGLVETSAIERLTIDNAAMVAIGVALLAGTLLGRAAREELVERLLHLVGQLNERLALLERGESLERAAASVLVDGTGAGGAVMYTLDDASGAPLLRCVQGASESGAQALAALDSRARAVFDQAVLKRRSIWLEPDDAASRAALALLERAPGQTVAGAVWIPLCHRARSYGVCVLAFAAPLRVSERIGPRALALLDTVGRTLGIAISHARHQEAIRHRSTHDALTGLPNRAALAQQLELSGEATLVLIDLDRFKEVNDTLGHDIGDRLLRHVGSVLRELGAEVNARVFRLGGDDFALLLAGDSRGTHAERLANRALARLAQPAELGGVSLAVDATIGIAVTDAGEADLRELLRRAEVAMYHGKASAAVVTRYRAQLDPHTRERLQLITELRSALAAGQLHLHYQPKVRLSDGALHGVEALLRWQHPQLGWIAPDRFVPMAELSPLINGITLWVAETAIAQIREWRTRGLALTVAINVSVRNLVQPGWCEELIERVRRAAIDPGALELEITETVLMQDAELSRERLGVLVEAGLRIAIDDFGTGYSSLAYLQQLPIHTLKIDRAFVMQLDRDAQSARIVETIMSLAGALKLRTVAEGIEDTDSAHYLTQLGCELGQGYLYSKPLAIAALEPWMAERLARLAAPALARGGAA